MDIELVEKKVTEGEVSDRAISQYIEQDQKDVKKIFWICLLIKVLLIYKCSLISKIQCEKCLVNDVSDSSLIFGNSSYCAIYLLITCLPIISLLFPHIVKSNRYKILKRNSIIQLLLVIYLIICLGDFSISCTIQTNIEYILYSVRKRLESIDVSKCSLFGCMVDRKQG